MLSIYMAFLSTSLTEATQRLRAGLLVALPTETVYGLAADAANEAAVRSVFALKGRPSHNPLIIHVSGKEMAQRYVQWNALADGLAEAHWPGALTLVLPKREDCPIAPSVSAGGDTLAIRMPAHPLAQSVIAAFDGGLAAPSANRSGRVSPTCAQHVLSEFAAAELMVMDGGACEVGVESTVIDCTEGQARLLRSGSVLIKSSTPQVSDSPKILKSPGMLTSHYAPSVPVRLNAVDVVADEALLAFGEPVLGADQALNLSPSRDMNEAAHNLFAMLRALDCPQKIRQIAVMPIPQTGIGIAINDRLARAAANKAD